MASLEDLDRRVTALERAAERDRSVERAVAEIVVESEKRITDKMTRRIEASEERMTKRIEASEDRMTKRIEASERRMVDVLNERFDAVMTALDRPNPAGK